MSPLCVRVFRTTHLCRSNARTVPSRDALTMTRPLEVKVTLEMLLVCSVKVTKQSPLLAFHTLTCGDKTAALNFWIRVVSVFAAD